MTPQQQRFVLEYLIDLNAAAAARRAGYSAKTARQQGERLTRNREVANAIAEAQERRLERTQLNADWVLRRIGDELEADLGDLFEEDGRLKPMTDWPLIWRQGLVAGVEVEELLEGHGDDREQVGRVYRIKLSDRVKRLELLGKHVYVSAFREKIDHTSTDGSMSPPSLAEFYGGEPAADL